MNRLQMERDKDIWTTLSCSKHTTFPNTHMKPCPLWSALSTVHARSRDATRADSIDPRGWTSSNHANPWPRTSAVPLIRRSGMVNGANHVNTRSCVRSRHGKWRRSASRTAQDHGGAKTGRVSAPRGLGWGEWAVSVGQVIEGYEAG